MPDVWHSYVQDPWRQGIGPCSQRRHHPAGRHGGPELSGMSQQLAYVIITPYTLSKSRTGGILARLITRTGLELVGARMFAPSAELVQQYSEAIVSANDPQDRRIQELIRDYILRNLSP